MLVSRKLRLLIKTNSDVSDKNFPKESKYNTDKQDLHK